MTTPKKSKKEFCCLILCGYGSGVQDGMILRNHLQNNGMDSYLRKPCGSEEPCVNRYQWMHSARLEYLHLRKQYRRVAVVGVSVGGLLLVHLLDLRPAAVAFVNTPLVRSHYHREAKRIYKREIKPGVRGFMGGYLGLREFKRMVKETRERGVGTVMCPVLVLQTMDDRVSRPENAEELFKRLHSPKKDIRFYPEGGHSVLASQTVMAVCSDIFQFCSQISGGQLPLDTPIRKE